MSATEESPAQRQARIRREKREAKIKGTAQDRLDKITMLSGRTPETVRSSSPAASPAATPQPPATPTPGSTASPQQLQAQEEYLRTLLRAPPPTSGSTASPDGAEEEDPMMKMLQSMLGAANGDPNAAQMPSLNPDDIAKATGLPSFLTNMMLGKSETPPTPAQQKETRIWIVLHILFALAAGLYMLFTIDKLTASFGANPPAPATFQSPMSVFVLGEALLHGSRLVLSSTPRKSGPSFWIQSAKELTRDASVMIFTLGAYRWWQGFA